MFVSPYCSCGWRTYVEMPDETTDEDAFKVVDGQIREHMLSRHGQKMDGLVAQLVGHERIHMKDTAVVDNSIKA